MSSILAGLAFVDGAVRFNSSDPMTAIRQKMIAGIDVQIAAFQAEISGQKFHKTRMVRIKDEAGNTTQEEKQARFSPWWFQDGKGEYYVSVKYGAKPVPVMDGKHVIHAGKKVNVEKVLVTLKRAVEAGELDQALQATRTRKRG